MSENSTENSGETTFPKGFTASAEDFRARLRQLKKAHPLDFDVKDKRATLRETWIEWTRPMTASELEELILSAEFGQRVQEAIIRTNDLNVAEGEEKMMIGQEFGFVVFRDESDIDPIHISPLFEGDETSINLTFQSEEYRKRLGLMGTPFLDCHTHPDLQSIFRKYLGKVNSVTQSEPNYFSEKDLKNFRSLAEQDMSLICALGIGNRRDSNGRLLLVSFNNFDQFVDFDPAAVLQKSRDYKKSHKAIPIKVYKDSGLNVAVLNINFRKTDSVFNAQEVAKASEIITSRVV